MRLDSDTRSAPQSEPAQHLGLDLNLMDAFACRKAGPDIGERLILDSIQRVGG
jgi:hypothetical protein